MEERKRKLDQSRQTVKKQQKGRRDSKRQIRKRESRNWEWWEKLPQEKEIWEEMIRGKKEKDWNDVR